MAYSTGRTTNRFAGTQGAREYEGKYLLVWQRTGDDWEIAAYAISSDQQEPGR
jgi:ketosteroid isomerase-like protein